MRLNVVRQIRTQRRERRRSEAHRAILHYEARLGGELFGPVAKGNRREFFCLDERTWVWHEEWTDTSGHRHVMTTRYDVRPNGVVKSQGNQSYQALTKEEAQNLYHAIYLYEQRVGTELERLAHVTG